MYLDNKIQDLIDKNITHIEYEGSDIDSPQAAYEIQEFIIGLMKGFGTEILKNYTITNKGWKHNITGKINSKEDIIKQFIKLI